MVQGEEFASLLQVVALEKCLRSCAFGSVVWIRFFCAGKFHHHPQDLEVVYLVLVKNTFIHVEDPRPTGGGPRMQPDMGEKNLLVDDWLENSTILITHELGSSFSLTVPKDDRRF